MSDPKSKLRAIIGELEAELQKLSTVDDEGREVLRHVMRDIEHALQQDTEQGEDSRSLIGRLSQAAIDFEGSHPTLSGIISRLVDGLGQMGI